MARKRTVAPSFSKSEQIANCSVHARLMFILMWNYCDDSGIHPASHILLKSEVFPTDDFGKNDMNNFVNELINNQLIDAYEVEGKKFWKVTGWAKHQIIDQKCYKYPLPSGSIPNSSTNRNTKKNAQSSHLSPSTRRVLAEYSAINGDCPHKEIIRLYHEVLPMCPKVMSWNKNRAAYLKARWREDAKNQNMAFWKKYFEHVAASKFLTGGCDGRNGQPPFVANLEWLVKANNFAKILEGNYHRDNK